MSFVKGSNSFVGFRQRKEVGSVSTRIKNKFRIKYFEIMGLKRKKKNRNPRFIAIRDGKGELNSSIRPSCIYWNGDQFWYKHGLIHRVDGPAITSKRGLSEQWFKNGQRHRIDGPATTDHHNNVKQWFSYGNRHRLDGPAFVMNASCEWYINGINVSERVLAWMKEYSINPNWKEWTDEELFLFRMFN